VEALEHNLLSQILTDLIRPAHLGSDGMTTNPHPPSVVPLARARAWPTAHLLYRVQLMNNDLCPGSHRTALSNGIPTSYRRQPATQIATPKDDFCQN